MAFKLERGCESSKTRNKTTRFNKVKDVNALQPQSSKHIIVQAACYNHPCNLLIDTGAAISLVNSNFIKHSNLSHLIKPTNILIAGVGKDIIPLKGQIRVPIVIDKQTVTHDFAICDSLDNQFLVGMDLLEKMQAKIDLQNKKLITPRGEVEFFTKPIEINKI